MDISFFRRGIKLPRRPPVGPLKEMPLPKQVVLLLKGANGAAFKPLVTAGEEVALGQPVAEAASGQVICASVSGEVTSLGSIRHTDGLKYPTVHITSTAAEAAPGGEQDTGALSQSQDALIKRLRQAGVTQAGNPSLLLADVLAPAGKAPKISHVAIRCFDNDPYLGTSEAITAALEQDIGDLEMGLALLKKVTDNAACHFILEKHQSAPGVTRFAKDNSCNIHTYDAFAYPSAAPALIARDILGSSGSIDPNQVHHAGVTVVDVGTVVEAVQAVIYGKNVINKVITVFGSGRIKALRTRLGTPIGDILDGAGMGSDAAKVILGGPLTGQACHSLDYPLTEGVTGLTVQHRDAVSLAADNPCLSCGLCAMVCPMRLVPGMLSRYCEYDHFESAADAGLFTCIECGCCAYVCPAERSMVQLFSHGKKEFLAQARSD
ncbi:MAG: hypothetical protein QNJ97_04000 [Myxococcota bacterium]|nr:hypothetical protein [Myxococcota bacterium]